MDRHFRSSYYCILETCFVSRNHCPLKHTSVSRHQWFCRWSTQLPFIPCILTLSKNMVQNLILSRALFFFIGKNNNINNNNMKKLGNKIHKFKDRISIIFFSIFKVGHYTLIIKIWCHLMKIVVTFFFFLISV